MKPSSSSTSYNDPMVIMASGVVEGQVTPAATFVVDNNPVNFTIYPNAYAAGATNTVVNAVRVKSFSGILTVVITFNGLLPATWTTPV